MELYGEVVKHKVFGRGQIVEFANNYVTVLFDENKAEKKFTYPTAFGSFLELENKSFLKQIEEEKIVIAQKEAESKRINEERAKAAIATKVQKGRVRNTNSATAKSSDRNNIAFKCNYCDGGKIKEVVGYKGVFSEQWLTFIEELTSLEIACWKDKYYDNDICDGTQWELVIRFPHGNRISKCGSNEYPPYWNKFIKIIKKYIDENIE